MLRKCRSECKDYSADHELPVHIATVDTPSRWFFPSFFHTLIQLFNLLFLLILSYIAIFFFILLVWGVDYLLKWGADNYTRIMWLYNLTIKTTFMSSNNKIPEYADIMMRKTSAKHTSIKHIPLLTHNTPKTDYNPNQYQTTVNRTLTKTWGK